jgi:hypothetical protein
MKRNKLILEFSEFNAQRLNPDSTQMSVHVDNPQLSINAFDRHEDGIRTGLSKINNILNSLSNTSSFRALKSKLALEEQNLSSLKVLRIFNRDNTRYDAFVSFVVDDEEYHGEIIDLLSLNPSFKSEVFKDFDLVQTKEWIIKTKGMIIKLVKLWMIPEKGKWQVVKDSIICYSQDTGKEITLRNGVEVEVIRSFDNKIVILYGNQYYNLMNDNFVYFNYWFEKI